MSASELFSPSYFKYARKLHKFADLPLDCDAGVGHILCFVIASRNPCLCFRISGAAVFLSPASVCRRGTILHVRLPVGRPVLLKELFLFSFFLLRNGLPSLGTGCNICSLPPSAKRSFRIHKKGSDRCSSLRTHAPHIYPL